MCSDKRDSMYTTGTLRGISISRLAKIPTLYKIAEIPELRKGLHRRSCIEGKGGFKSIHCIAQNATLYVDLLLKSFVVS